MLLIDLTSEVRNRRKNSVTNCKIVTAVDFAIHVSPCVEDVAYAVHVSEDTIRAWTDTPEWKWTSEFFGSADPVALYDHAIDREKAARESRGLRKAERLWARVIEKSLDLRPSEIESDPVLKRKMTRAILPDRTGLECITWKSRLYDWTITAPVRLKSALWALYVKLFV